MKIQLDSIEIESWERDVFQRAVAELSDRQTLLFRTDRSPLRPTRRSFAPLRRPHALESACFRLTRGSGGTTTHTPSGCAPRIRCAPRLVRVPLVVGIYTARGSVRIRW